MRRDPPDPPDRRHLHCIQFAMSRNPQQFKEEMEAACAYVDEQ